MFLEVTTGRAVLLIQLNGYIVSKGKLERQTFETRRHLEGDHGVGEALEEDVKVSRKR